MGWWLFPAVGVGFTVFMSFLDHKSYPFLLTVERSMTALHAYQCNPKKSKVLSSTVLIVSNFP